MCKGIRRVIVWTPTIYNLLHDIGKVGGIAVQMTCWAETFAKNGWQVYSFSDEKKTTENGIIFIKYFTVRYIGILLELIFSLFYILTIRPDIILFRGASRSLWYLSLFSKLISAKLVHFGASDSDFMPEEELIRAKHDRRLYRKGLKRVKYVVVQNHRQADLLIRNYNYSNKYIVIHNIYTKNKGNHMEKSIDFLWVSNIRDLKRPLWFLKLAKENPAFQFVMVGGAHDQALYNQCEEKAREIENLSFLGSKTLNEVNDLFAKTKCFVCTSIMEGFPNTFLQAWSNNMPVLSTFDPSYIIKDRKVGICAADYDELKEGLHTIVMPSEYEKMKANVVNYFEQAHNPQKMFERLIMFIS